MKKDCVLYDRECINCGECDICDLDPKKKCDNCGACLEMDDDYKTVDVDLTIEEDAGPEVLSYEELFPEKAFIGEQDWDEDDESDEELEDDFDNDDNFYEDEVFDDYDSEDEDEDLSADFGDFFG